MQDRLPTGVAILGLIAAGIMLGASFWRQPIVSDGWIMNSPGLGLAAVVLIVVASARIYAGEK